MPSNFNNQPFGMPAGNREAAGGQALVIITAALAGSNRILLLTAYLIAAQIQHRRVPSMPPSLTLLLLFYAAGLACPLGAVLRPRFRTLSVSLLPHREFSPQVFTGCPEAIDSAEVRRLGEKKHDSGAVLVELAF